MKNDDYNRQKMTDRKSYRKDGYYAPFLGYFQQLFLPLPSKISDADLSATIQLFNNSNNTYYEEFIHKMDGARRPVTRSLRDL